MTKKDLLKRLEKYDDDTMILFGEYIKGATNFAWDNIELIQYGSPDTVYVFCSGEVEHMYPNELQPLVIGC